MKNHLSSPEIDEGA